MGADRFSSAGSFSLTPPLLLHLNRLTDTQFYFLIHEVTVQAQNKAIR